MDQKKPNLPPPEKDPAKPAGHAPPAAAAPAEGGSAAAQKLTPEEQMALFEKDLKENDWGHRPC